MLKFSQLSDNTRGSILAFLSGFTYAFLGYFGLQVVQHDMSIDLMLFYRNLIAAICFLPFIVKRRQQIKTYNSKTLLRILVINSIFFSGSSYFFFLASKTIGTGLSMTLFFTYPAILVGILTIFDNYKAKLITIVCIAMILCGCYFIAVVEKNLVCDVTGIYAALAGAFCYSTYIFLGKNQVKVFDAREVTFLLCVGNVIMFYLLSLANNEFKFPVMDAHLLFNIGALGIFCTALPILFFLQSVQYISSTKASIISVCEPVVTLIIGITLLGETIIPIQFLGIALIILSALIIQIEK